MNTDAHLMRMPGAWAFVDCIVRDMRQHQRNVIVYVPDHLPLHQIWGQISGYLNPQGESCIRYLHPAPNVEPIQALWKADDLPEDVPPTIENLLHDENAAEFYYLQGLDELPETDQRLWSAFIRRWAQASQQMDRRGNSGLIDRLPLLISLIPAQLKTMHMNGDVRLSLHWWSGIPSLLEAQLLCRTGSSAEIDDEDRRWREYLMPELFSGDLDLLEFLWKPLVHMHDLDGLISQLERYAQQRGWNTADMQSAIVPRGLAQKGPSYLSHELQELWARGWLYESTEYGWELHSAVLVAQDNRCSNLERRLWRGQARLLLPLLDDMRLVVIEHFNNHQGTGWSAKWINPEYNPKLSEPVSNPYDVDWGLLRWFVKENSPNGNRVLLPLIHSAWDIRNRIAHFKPVSLSDYRTLMKYYTSWRNGDTRA